MDIEELLRWAEGHAENLAASPQALSRLRARVTAALDFLERFSGTGSRWSKDARYLFNFDSDMSMEVAADTLGNMIMEWTRMVRCGLVNPRLESFSVRAASSTDLLDQVRALNTDRAIVPAAPIVLAGAALEVALRAAVKELDLTLPGRPSIDAYAKALRQADVLTTQDMKDITQMAGLRNDAAHGEHDQLSREQAGMMEQQANFFLARLEPAVQQSAG